MKVLITSVGTSTSIGLIKAYRGKAGRSWIIGADTNEYGLTAGSLLVDEFRRVPPAASESFSSELVEIVDSLGVDVVIPINDVEVAVASRMVEDGELNCVCLVPGYETALLCADKLAMTERASAVGVPCPRIVDASYPGFKIYREKESVGSKGVVFLAPGESASADLEKSVATGEGFFQERICGSEYTVDVLSDAAGEPVYVVPRERIEVKAGVATKARVSHERDLIGYAQAIAKDLRIPGFSNIQFMRDASGKPFFIEVNPRFGGCSASSLLAAPGMFDAFLAVVSGDAGLVPKSLNHDVKWGSIVTRYYEEVLYEG